jgi:hypothetical protein
MKVKFSLIHYCLIRLYEYAGGCGQQLATDAPYWCCAAWLPCRALAPLMSLCTNDARYCVQLTVVR